MLLDTHVLIWLLAGDERLGTQAREHIEAERRTASLLVSPVSYYETATLVRRNRVNLGTTFERWSETIRSDPGIGSAALDADVASLAGKLPDDIHGDPHDRMLIATAITHRTSLLTADRKILSYAAAGHLSTIDARL